MVKAQTNGIINTMNEFSSKSKHDKAILTKKKLHFKLLLEMKKNITSNNSNRKWTRYSSLETAQLLLHQRGDFLVGTVVRP